MPCAPRPVVAGLLWLVLGGMALAQQAPGRSLAPLAVIPGELRREGLGADVAVLGDLDGDGIREWAAGRSGPRSQPPEVRVFSGGSGALLYTLEGRGQFDSIFLEAVVELGDLDGDGVSDLGLANANALHDLEINVGAVDVISGATGERLYTRWGIQSFRGFGASLAALGDVDGDTVPDFVAGAIGTLDENVWLVSGAQGELLRRIRGPSGLGDIEFGWSSAGLDDADGDGAPDLAVGTRTGGFVDAYSSATGALLWHATGGSSFGRVLATIDDLDGDGARDLVVGEPEANRARVLSGRDGSRRLLLEAPDGVSFGTAIAAVGDVDRDGRPDLAVGDPGQGGRRGRVQVFSGRHGRLLFEARGAQPGDQLGASVAGGLDVDANGWPEIVIGAPGADGAGKSVTDAGEVGLWSTWPASPTGHAHR